MNKFITLILLLIFSIGCEKDNPAFLCASIDGPEDFLNFDTLSFTATINDEDVSWVFGSTGISGASSFEPGFPDENNRLIASSITKFDEYSSCQLTLPRFNIENEDEFNAVFELGEKGFGPQDTGFRFSITENSAIFNSDSDNVETTLVLLKIKEELHPVTDKPRIKAWFLIDGILTDGDGNIKNVQNGRLRINFSNYKL